GGHHDDGPIDAQPAPVADAQTFDAPPAETDASVTSMVVGAAGGTLTTPDGVVLDIPAGALAADTPITITHVGDPAGGTFSAVYELGPDGTVLDGEATLTLPYQADLLQGQPENDLALAFAIDEGTWQGVGWAAIDTGTHTVSGYVTHFSRWAIVPSQGA